jgi:hypothetical protein
MNRYVQPIFERQLIEDRRMDGYWIEAFDINNDSKPDLVAYGLNMGEVNWYKNPGWQKQSIEKFIGPVGMHHGDIDQDGWMDIVICYEYGKTMIDCDPEGGKIAWLKNPRTSGGSWERHYIGRATAMHRLRVGFFTQDKKLEVLALPIVGAPRQVHSIAPVLLFTQPDDLENAKQWNCQIIDDQNFRVIHGVTLKKFRNALGLELDSALIASEEGVTWLYYDPQKQQWCRVSIGSGELCEVSKTGFKGSGDVAVGKIADDDWAYIATVEPFHGNTIAVYSKDPNSSVAGDSWKRVVLDVFGEPNPLGEGPGHFVVCADFDNDGDDEFLVALRGPMPWQGVFYYKAVDIKNGAFVKWRVSSDSAARIAVGDFNGDGRLDFATIGYSVKGYFCAENPSIAVFHNQFASPH